MSKQSPQNLTLFIVFNILFCLLTAFVLYIFLESKINQAEENAKDYTDSLQSHKDFMNGIQSIIDGGAWEANTSHPIDVDRT